MSYRNKKWDYNSQNFQKKNNHGRVKVRVRLKLNYMNEGVHTYHDVRDTLGLKLGF